MEIRKKHKQQLKQLLQSLIYEGKNLIVDDYYQTNDEAQDFFVTIVSAGIKNNELDQNVAYYPEYSYFINVIFDVYESLPSGFDEKVDAIEELIYEALISRNARDCLYWNNPNERYHDLKVTEISDLFSPELELQETKAIKTFSIVVNEIVTI